MPRVKNRNVHRHISDFDKGRIVAYPHCGLSYRNISARVGRDLTSVSKIWNRWIQNSNTVRRTASQRFYISRSREEGILPA
ncbi:HTH_Tnp_Tc3_2 domain-containing protein [Trichonephila clavipes]|nr:HTH_Tnp_Tc3_2 domain-containing protein [Trichonephila clavipes]